jgi:hypothetical protein
MADEPRKERPLRDLATALELERLAAARVERNRAVHEALSPGDAGPWSESNLPDGEPVDVWGISWGEPGILPGEGVPSLCPPPNRYPPLRVRLGWWWIEVKHRLSHAWDALRGLDCDR